MDFSVKMAEWWGLDMGLVCVSIGLASSWVIHKFQSFLHKKELWVKPSSFLIREHLNWSSDTHTSINPCKEGINIDNGQGVALNHRRYSVCNCPSKWDSCGLLTRAWRRSRGTANPFELIIIILWWWWWWYESIINAIMSHPHPVFNLVYVCVTLCCAIIIIIHKTEGVNWSSRPRHFTHRLVCECVACQSH